MLKFARLLGVCLCIAGLSMAQVGAISAANPTETNETPAATAPIKVPVIQATETLTATQVSETPAAEVTAAPKGETTETPAPVADHTPAAAAPEKANAEPTPIPAERAALPTIAPDLTFQNSVKGMVINWAYRNETEFPVVLSGGGWSLEAKTDSNAQFVFETLGEGIALLNPIIAKGSDLHPMAVDLAVPVSGPADRVINVGLYGGKQYPTGLPMSVQMKASATKVNPGEEVQFVVDVKNDMPHTVHEVMVTDLMPEGLTPTYIETSTGTPWFGGQFAASSIGTLEEGQSAVVTITAQLAPNASSEKAITTRANVLYQESVALQASATINGEVPNVLPETGAGALALPLGGLLVMVAVVGLRRVRLSHVA
jgi:uncharacterized repeat protein (TIGR01451 family)